MRVEDILGIRPGQRFSYEIIGDIAVAEWEGELNPQRIFEAITQVHPHIRTVLRKGETRGVFRVRSYDWVAGERRTITEHREHGCRYLLDLSKVHFSPRLAFERARIAEKVEPEERVCVFFAGIGPYPILIARRKKARTVGIELNPYAYFYFRKNVEINRVGDWVLPVFGDVRRLAWSFPRYFQRVVMPLPKKAGEFLREAEAVLERGWVHTYLFARRGEEEEAVEQTLKKFRREVREFTWRRVRPHSPSTVQLALDVLLV